MNGLDIHLLVNHIPVIGIPIGVLVALGGMLFKAEAVKKTGLIIFIATGVFVFPANFSGEDAEDIVEDNVRVGLTRPESTNMKKQQRPQ